ncbi:DUF485 domain-containing protein [Rhizobium sp. XQZ8]|uniref:DUF485 domain-containing protein n=1 Tax=Rhizobium populisoli TaxID=2859785 RepID=UPI001C66EECE|nr:DUF485 domain-containing protein [Rhizobium populisoli]MBW6424295.1 DUF485 domain-containing protein [Rhizobium populisoli]
MDAQIRAGDLEQIRNRPLFRRISFERNCLGAVLAMVMAALYFTFICIVAFSPATLASPVAAGSSISIGVIAGVSLMVTGLGLTAVYALYASVRLDKLASALRKELP